MCNGLSGGIYFLHQLLSFGQLTFFDLAEHIFCGLISALVKRLLDAFKQVLHSLKNGLHHPRGRLGLREIPKRISDGFFYDLVLIALVQIHVGFVPGDFFPI